MVAGSRTLASITRQTSSTGWPSRIARTPGRRRPSWKIDVLSAPSVPGLCPPTSTWWAQVPPYAASSPSTKIGANAKMSGVCAPPR